MERKIYSGTPSLEQLNIGDSLVDFNRQLWHLVVQIPQDVAETWIAYSKDSYLSTRSRVNESPMKDWQAGFGIIIGTTMDNTIDREKLFLLEKHAKDDFRLYESVSSRLSYKSSPPLI